MEHPFPAPRVEMITQEYLAASLELRARTDLTVAHRQRLKDDLADEHELHCAHQWKSVSAQMRADQEAGSRSLSEPTPVLRRAHKPRPSPVDLEDDGDDEPARVGVHHEETWEQYLEAERRELEGRKEGHLAKLLARYSSTRYSSILPTAHRDFPKRGECPAPLFALLILGGDCIALWANHTFGSDQAIGKSCCTEYPVKPLELPEGPVGDEPGQ